VRDANRFCFRGGMFDARLKQHAPNLIRKP
jgi:hypothetical protein